MDAKNVVYYTHLGVRVPVDQKIVNEIKATAEEADVDPGEFISEIVIKTYEKLNAEKVKQKREELIAKLHALRTQGL